MHNKRRLQCHNKKKREDEEAEVSKLCVLASVGQRAGQRPSIIDKAGTSVTSSYYRDSVKTSINYTIDRGCHRCFDSSSENFMRQKRKLKWILSN